MVDNCSTDGSRELFEKMNNINYYYQNKNYGFGIANNIGAKHSSGSILILINPDVIISNKTKIKKLLGIINNDKNIGLLSCKIKYPDNTIQSVGEKFPTVYNVFLQSVFFINYRFMKKYINNPYADKGLFQVDWITGAFLIIKKSLFNLLGGFDNKIFLNAEDIDLAARVEKLGYYNMVYDKCEVIHFHGQSKKKANYNISFSNYKKNLNSYKMVIKKNKLSKYPELLVQLKLYHFRIRAFLNELF